MYAAAPAGHTMLQKTITPKANLRDGDGKPSNTVSDEGIIYMCVGSGGSHLYDQADWAWAEHDAVNAGMASNNEGSAASHWRLQGWAPAGCYLNKLTTYSWSSAPGIANQGSSPYWLGTQVGSPSVATTNGSNSWTDGASYNDTGADTQDGTWTGGGSCEGRCGAGCPRAYNWYFTKDCLDHDICLDFHTTASSTSYSGDCGFEFSDAQGDFTWGSSVTYQGTYCGNVPSDCTENGNSAR
jgi:hypothetical protein